MRVENVRVCCVHRQNYCVYLSRTERETEQPISVSSDSLCMKYIESHTNNGISFLKFSIDCRLLHASSAKYPKRKPLRNSSIGGNVYCSTMRCLFPAKCKFRILSLSILEAKHLNMFVFMCMCFLIYLHSIQTLLVAHIKPFLPHLSNFQSHFHSIMLYVVSK